MKKKILSILLMVMAVTMVLAVSAWATSEPGTSTGGDSEIVVPPAEPTEIKVSFKDGNGTIYDSGSKTTVQLVVDPDVKNVTWKVYSGDSVTVSSTGLVTAVKNGKSVVRASYDLPDRVLSNDITIDVQHREIKELTCEETLYIQKHYYIGESFNTDGIVVKAKYSDSNDLVTIAAGDYTIEPSVFDKTSTNKVTIKYEGKSVDIDVKVDEKYVTGVTIISPADNSEIEKGKSIDSVTIKVDYSNDTSENKTIKKTDTNSEITITGYILGTAVNDTANFTATYKGKTSAPILVTAKQVSTLDRIEITKNPTKTSYAVGQEFSTAGMEVTAYYSDGTSKKVNTVSISSPSIDTTTKKFKTTGTATITVSFTDNKITRSKTLSVSVITGASFEGLIDEDDTDKDYPYELQDKIKLQSGDKLNTSKGISWDDIFYRVYVSYKEEGSSRTKYKSIRKDSDLEEILPGAKLMLGVYKKNNNYDRYPLDEITSSSFNSDGEIELILYVEYGDKKYTDTRDEAIVVTVTAEGSGVVVNLHRSSSSSVYDSVAFDDIEEAFDALEDDKYDDFSSTVRSSDYFVIKLYEDQDLGRSFNFEPETDNNITIDLNGFELTLPSNFINWNRDNEDMVLTVTNNNSKKDGKLTYRDLNISSITVEKSDKLEFKEDVIPGFYTIKAETGSHGTVEVRLDGSKISDPSKEFSAPKDGKLIFTITPDKGYEISTVKANSSSVTSSSDYSVSTGTGVATYEVKAVKDLTLSVTFKEASKTSDSSKDDSGSKGASTDNWSNPFTDITSRDAYYDSVAFVCANGIFNGTSSNKFSPTMSMTRAMFVTAVGRLAEKSQGIDIKNNSAYQTSSFKDVSKTDAEISYAIPYIEWASINGITQGVGDGKFDPKTPITHAQMYTFMYRYAMFVEKLNPSVSNIRITVSDKNDIPTWAEDAVKFATQSSLIISSGGRITPNDNALRWELATIIGGFAKKVLGW